MLHQAIEEKYGFKEGLDIKGGRIVNWPYEAPKPTAAALKKLAEDYRAKVLYRLERAKEYPIPSDQLDEILKTLNLMRMGITVDLIDSQGNPSTHTLKINLPSGMDSILADWLAVKAKYPKPK